jgi:hypothetical protein
MTRRSIDRAVEHSPGTQRHAKEVVAGNALRDSPPQSHRKLNSRIDRISKSPARYNKVLFYRHLKLP